VALGFWEAAAILRSDVPEPVDLPFISVVLPTYNRAGIVLEAVQSVLDQSFKDFELIVVDDSSADDSVQVLGAVAARDPRVRVISNSRTKGSAGARNAGIDDARGEWLCQIDSDDVWQPDFLDKLAVVAARSPGSVGVVYGSHKVVEYGTGKVVRERQAELSGFTYPKMLEEHYFYHGASAIRMDLVRRVGGYDEYLKSNEDTDFQVRVTELCELRPVPEAVYIYQSGWSDQLSRDDRLSAIAYDSFFKKHEAAIRKLPKARYSAVYPGLVTSVRARLWGLAFRNWRLMLPLAVAMPRRYLRCQYDVARLVARQLLVNGSGR
jgi:glycosyltransferase involved in cell wall biosynthesis